MIQRLAALAVALSCSPAVFAQSYERDIAPLLADRCAICHQPNGAAPFSLLTYDDAKRHARQIADVTRSRYMPPWKVDPSNGPFVGQRPLSEHEIDVIQRWTAAGAPGTPAPGTPAPGTPAPGTAAPSTQAPGTAAPAPSTQHPAPSTPPQAIGSSALQT